ncbi:MULTISPECIES: DUF6491 family protein [Phenylobacterium]|uniref:Lipoprotein n=1 Tax=Phenylobacterium koreense TaxID=266125 RepID=A0ABV2EGM5_9CAUL
MIRASLGAGCAALLLLAACATRDTDGRQSAAGDNARRQCFWAQSVSGFSAIDDQTVIVTVGVNNAFRLDLFSRCPDVDWNQRIALVSRGGSSICSGLDATIITRGPGGMQQRCQVRTVTKLTPEEAAALRARPRSR